MTTPNRNPQALILAALAGVAVAALTVWGWHTFFFLTDDAHIEFRYVSNLLAGRGLTWNPPPFKPVEGYTSLSWVLLLAAVWKVTGVAPPQSAGVLSLLIGLGTLTLVVSLGLKAVLPAGREKWRWGIVAVALLGTLTNRTFFTWLSSGLETSLFNFTFTWWVVEGFRLARGGAVGRAPWRWSAAALAMALTRPDGMLAVLAVALWLVLQAARRQLSVRQAALHALPLLGVPVHVLWRYAYYGAWLPNTYYAKHVERWTESGVRYLASFILEYGLWVWLPLALAFVALGFKRHRGALTALVFDNLAAFAVVGVLLGHVGYYTLIIGGDHFEYRVLSYLIPLLFLSGGWLAARLFTRPLPAFAWVLTWVVVSWPIPWTHWQMTHNLNTRAETHVLRMPIAAVFLPPFRPVAQWWDELQAWLIWHHVGMRHQEHKIFYEAQLGWLPTRAEGEKLKFVDNPVSAQMCVGVVGWVLPNVAILDTAGLNDWVIARNPVTRPKEERLMAHDRSPPPGYLDCFMPNVSVGKVSVVNPRPAPLTDDAVRACERRFGAL
ncbi:MAG: hypothetical protein K1X64_22610 [Myxococcaceae bacterium]|nr:hypothetical protein [Myxococcaceae bacterium]